MASRATKTILVAEDDQGVRDMCQIVLKKAGYHVICAEDGEDALRQYEIHASEIDLLVLDVMMPGLNGSAVYDNIHKKRPEIPALLASGYGEFVVDDSRFEEDSVMFISKPFTRDDLISKVRQLLASRTQP
jgi:DNA-binding NtrC family response regulator